MTRILALILCATPAFALNQSVHYQIAYDSCRAHDLPEPFCDQVAVADHDVDSYEFNILAAHSQMENGQTACDGANAAIWRVFWYGQQIRQGIAAVVYDESEQHIFNVAYYVGKALHAVQDNCAHSGMPNPQHAWKSLNDICEGTSTSPDLVPEAATCAREETDAVFDAVYEAVTDWGATKAVFANIRDHENHLTSYNDACHYLGSANDWDGVDRRWDNNFVRPFMRNEIVSAITSDNARHDWICNYVNDSLLVSYDDDVDTSGGAESCVLIHAFCLGKADEVQAAPPATMSAGGCDVAGGGSGGWLLITALFALALFLRSRHA